MRKQITLSLMTAIFLFMTSCGGKITSASIDYGMSEIYSKTDMDDAIKLIEEEFSDWDGCELHTISYISDDCNCKENIEWMNSLGDTDMAYTQCIMFESNFHSPKSGGGAWNPNSEYTNWEWWLARSDNGEWNLMTWGYG